MANFPNSVTVYTTRNPGDTIPSADWDSFGAEISAIEDGLINGTAPIHTSNTQVNSLQVSSNSTFNGLVTFNNRAVCIVSNSTLQNVANNVGTGLSFDVNVYDPQSMHSTGVNSSRINLRFAGTYLLTANIKWSAGSTAGDLRIVGIPINDVSAFAYQSARPISTAGTAMGQSFSVIYQTASTTDYATVAVQQDSGSTMSISSGNLGLRFAVSLIGV